MTTALLPSNCRVDGLVDALAEANAFADPPPQSLVVHVPAGGFVHSSAMAFLCVWARHLRANGTRILFRGDARTLSYLSRMGLDGGRLGLRPTDGGGITPSQTAVAVTLIETDEDVEATSVGLSELLLQQFEDAARFIPAVHWAMDELVDNIINHAASPQPGAVCAQYFPRRHRLDIAICDAGRGIRASLMTSEKLRSEIRLGTHGEAITAALQRGVSRDLKSNQGNGMAGSLEIVQANGGDLDVWSGDVVFRVRGGKEVGFRKVPEVQGTGLMLSLDTRRPVDLENTWIGKRGAATFTYIERIAWRLEENGLRVADEAASTSTRRAARALRVRLEKLLPEMEEPLVIDFDRVERATSSFLDELLSKLVLHLGREEFARRVQVVGMSDRLRAMAEVVIEQRVESR